MKRVILVLAISAALVALVAAVAVAASEGRTFQCVDVDCTGTNNDDTISERTGSVQDNIDAMDGNDTVNAALFGSDADTVRGGAGSDVIRTDDGDTRDDVNGGGGFDVCIIDKGDDRENCEEVIRR